MRADKHIRDVRRLAVKALQSGGSVEGPARAEWDVAGDCQSPIRVVLTGRAFRGIKPKFCHGVENHDRGMLNMYIEARCRRCEKCLRAKARLWAGRARAETLQAKRTWFVTLTCRPDVHVLHEYRARKKWNDEAKRFRGVEGLPEPKLWEQASETERFRARVAVLLPEVQKFFKRLRKQTGKKLRYILVAEAHKGELCGRPHFHALIHEPTVEHIGKREIEEQWRLGFSKVKLVAGDGDNARRSAWYVCKYITKSEMARVVASLRYGEGAPLTVSKAEGAITT